MINFPSFVSLHGFLESENENRKDCLLRDEIRPAHDYGLKIPHKRLQASKNLLMNVIGYEYAP